ncbi:hypothetical protein IFM53868_04537 [Aspergillus udagawae]|uniref:Uncharacterized protein n=1 Tax=Aspergillus udagawae TaxID=91492 RepID=A0ABQ1APH3_9EURO|nr:hypothetical protein IFM53868_04537 [Aspergillus udagawae]GFG06246.1 hypothetical protein IFM5058_02825 [Aspergillus udagawae]
MSLFTDLRRKGRACTRAIEKVKAAHWKEFLDKAGEGHLWEAAPYMKPRDAWGCIPNLKVGTEQLINNEDKAQDFMDTFFPKMAKAEKDRLAQPPLAIHWSLITELEIYHSLKAAKSAVSKHSQRGS